MKYSTTRLFIALSVFFAFLSACTDQANSPSPQSNVSAAQNGASVMAPNFILMIGDDMAVETLSCYDVGTDVATTPTLDQLCDDGIRFDNFWSQPVCSPTRATLLTGQYGFANGVGAPITSMQGIDWKVPNAAANAAGATAMGTGMAGAGMAAMGANAMATANGAAEDRYNPSIEKDAKTFVQALKSGGDYQTAAVGKWHLANNTNGGFDHPAIVGFDHYSGSLRAGGVTSFTGWSKTIDGSEPFGKTGYAESDKVDDGIAWLEEVDSDKPWLLWVAFNAPHTPFHKPPPDLLNSETAKALAADGPSGVEDQVDYYRAMIEAMDTEIGRLLASLDEDTRANTYVIFMGDNGTPGQTTTAPFVRGKSKGSVYQGGINVPMMIAGPGIEAGQSTGSLANSVDFFATILDLSGIPLEGAKPAGEPFHSVSLQPILHTDVNTEVRQYAYADVFGFSRNGTTNSRAIRNVSYKLIQHMLDDTEEFYNLDHDPYENNNLLVGELNEEQQENFAALKARVGELLGAP